MFLIFTLLNSRLLLRLNLNRLRSREVLHIFIAYGSADVLLPLVCVGRLEEIQRLEARCVQTVVVD